VVAAAEPGRAIGCGQQRVDLVGGEETDDGPVASLGRDRQHPADVVGVFGCVQRRVTEQRSNRGQASVAGGGAVGAFGFQVVQERGDQRGVEVREVETARGGSRCAGGELQQQPPGVAVGGDRVGTGAALPDQLVGEESLQDRGQRGHRR
jgi:hypothetical protein